MHGGWVRREEVRHNISSPCTVAWIWPVSGGGSGGGGGGGIDRDQPYTRPLSFSPSSLNNDDDDDDDDDENDGNPFLLTSPPSHCCCYCRLFPDKPIIYLLIPNYY